MKSLLFKILSFLYGIGVGFRNTLFNLQILKTRDFNLPIISVGNITAGGTGKTPHTEYIIELLHHKFRVATLSRGYKRKTKGFLMVHPESTAKESGDEPLQIKQKFPEVIVAVDEKRVHGIEKLLELPLDERPEVVILDDAFQHRYVNPGINILLTDYNRLITHDTLLPHGLLREPAINRERANIIIVTKCPMQLKPIDERIITKELNIRPFQYLYFSTFKYGKPLPVFPDKTTDSQAPAVTGKQILLVTGIANPEPLYNYLVQNGATVKGIYFPDHHNYSSKDIKKITAGFDELSDEKIIITTEKDMVRFRKMSEISDQIAVSFYYIPLKVTFMNHGEIDFNQKIEKYVRENKSNFDLYSRSKRL